MGPMTSRTVATSSFLSSGGGGYSVPCHTQAGSALHARRDLRARADQGSGSGVQE